MSTEPIEYGMPDARCLAETEARLRKFLQPAAVVVPPRFEAVGMVPQVEPHATPSGHVTREISHSSDVGMRRQRALERLRGNPREVVRRRLQRKGIEVGEQSGAMECFAVFGGEGSPRNCHSPTDLALGLERIIGRNELLGVQYLEGGREAARSVGRILVRRGPSRMAPLGTGFLVGAGLLLTNNHVLPTQESARGGTVEFNYQCGMDGSMLPSVSFELDPEAFYWTSASTELDFTLVAVRDVSSTGAKLDEFGRRRLVSVVDEVLDGESVTIIQHPNGEPKQIALRENFVLKLPDATDRYLYYQTDTTPGSSGSPVFNDDWELVALHHSGFAQRNDKGEVLARDGRVWDESMGVDQIDWIANEGVRIGAIVNHLRAVRELEPEKLNRLRSVLSEDVAGTSVNVQRQGTALQTIVGNKPQTDLLDAATTIANGVAAAKVAESPNNGKSESMNTPIGKTDMSEKTAGNDVVEAVIHVPLHISVRIGALGNGVTIATPSASAVLPTGTLEKIEIDTDYRDREGYDPKFLGTGKRRVPLPELTSAMKELTVKNQEPVSGAPAYEFPYYHFSVVINAQRRMAFFTAVNIDGTLEKDLGKRENDKWIRDVRANTDVQIGDEWYAKPFDRGHLVRRLDPAWGRTPAIAKAANDDTFHFTNCCPQHARFNQGKNLWQGLENYLLDTAQAEDRRISVFTGPVYASDDPTLKAVQIPQQFWKVAAFVRPNGSLGACGFVVSQADLLRGEGLESAAEAVARTFQVRIREVERLTKLDFGLLRTLDTMASGNSPLESGDAAGEVQVELESLEQIRL